MMLLVANMHALWQTRAAAFFFIVRSTICISTIIREKQTERNFFLGLGSTYLCIYVFIVLVFDSSPPITFHLKLDFGFLFFWLYISLAPFPLFFFARNIRYQHHAPPLFFLLLSEYTFFPESSGFAFSLVPGLTLLTWSIEIDLGCCCLASQTWTPLFLKKHIYIYLPISAYLHPREKKKSSLKKKKDSCTGSHCHISSYSRVVSKHNPKGSTERGKPKTPDLYQPNPLTPREKERWQTNTAL